nr:HAD family phosphatase [uncultured Bacteroides sp.]
MNREMQHSLAEDFIGHTGHAVVTSSYKDIAMTYLENAGLLNICEYITSLESINFPKPNPEPYLFTMEKLQITNRDCIAVEDSPSGIRSARSAGLFTVAWVKDVNDTKYEDANIILSKLSSPQITSFFL